MKSLKNILLEGYAWERKPGQPLPTLSEVQAEYLRNEAADAVKAKVAKLEKEGKTNQDPDYKYFSKIHTKEILDNLGLDRYCCRRMILSASDMMHII